MVVEQLGSGLAGQIGIATESEVALNTIVTPDTFIEFESEGIARDTVEVGVQGMAGTLFARSGRKRTVFRGATGPLNNVPILTTGLARLLRHCFGGYVFSWPGSTNATGTLTLAAVPSNNDTMTIGSQVYTFKTTLTAATTANEIKIAATIALQASYIAAAINRTLASDGQGSGEIYGSLTRLNADVTAVAGASSVTLTDKQGRGAGANTVVTTETFTDAGNVFGAATLASGVNGTDTRRLHTYTIDGSKLRELAMTVQKVVPASESSRKSFTYAGGKVLSWQLNAPGDGALMITPTVQLRSESLAVAAAAASYAADADFFSFTEYGLTIDGDTEPIQGISLTANLGISADRYQTGTSVGRNQLITARPELTGQIEREFENRNLYDAWVAGEEAALVMTATGGQIPSSASFYQFIATMPVVRYMGATPQIGGPDIVRTPIPFEIMDGGSDPPITCQYYTDEGYAGDNG